jgi:phosphoserine aminotransferase
MKRVFNFNAGPAILPELVLEEAAQGIREIHGSGMSILEVSHRAKTYERIHGDARDRLLRLLRLDPSEYAALFLGGGASLQFAMLPMNFLEPGSAADYVHTGEWSKKAMMEARRFGSVNIAGSSEAERFSRIPKDLVFTSGARYAHITTNNTIEGTEFSRIPDTGATPLVADMSSDILAREIDHSRFSLIYAGAQKNAGPAGVTLVVARRSFLEQARGEVATILSYKTHLAGDSLYNTPPVFGVYVVGLVLQWIEAQGGLGEIEKVNRRKAEAIYDALDEFPDVYEPTVQAREDRSIMNITFRLRRGPEHEKRFLSGAEERQMIGLKGHRSVGGIRASVYNALPEKGALRLAEYLREFARN